MQPLGPAGRARRPHVSTLTDISERWRALLALLPHGQLPRSPDLQVPTMGKS